MKTHVNAFQKLDYSVAMSLFSVITASQFIASMKMRIAMQPMVEPQVGTSKWMSQHETLVSDRLTADHFHNLDKGKLENEGQNTGC
jgi:hypothetical protein